MTPHCHVGPTVSEREGGDGGTGSVKGKWAAGSYSLLGRNGAPGPYLIFISFSSFSFFCFSYFLHSFCKNASNQAKQISNAFKHSQ
jgi:hypothetical protein